MNDKIKAKQLVEKYLNLSVNVIHTDCEGDISIAAGTPTQSHAKQCALICANEMIDVLWHTHINPDEFNYWQAVKTEIEKI